MNVRIKDIADNEKPRERLLLYGIEKISNEELLTLIIRSGSKDYSSKTIASLILKEFGGIEGVKNLRIEELVKIKGIGVTKAIEIIASIEFGKRVNNYKTKCGVVLNNSKIIFETFKNDFVNETQEKFMVLYLDSKSKLISSKIIFVGTLNQSCVHPREIFKEAYKVSAASIICIHNHPSGDPSPSNNDIEVTDLLTKVSEIMGIKLIDHIIFGSSSYFSFYENMNN